MGTIYKRGSVYYADFVGRGNQRVQVSLRTKDRSVAKARLRDFELSTTHSGPHASQGLSDALDWYTDVECASKPEGTKQMYKQKARHLSRVLGNIALDAITRDLILQFISKRREEGAAPHSIHKELTTLRQTLKAAKARTPSMFHGDIGVVIPKFDATYEPRRTFLSQEQFMLLAQHLVPPPLPQASPETIANSEERRGKRILFIMMIAFASPRLGELTSMRWEEHVDLSRDLLIIPKGKTVSRTIAIAPELRQWLEVYGTRAGFKGPVIDAWGSCRRDLARACKRAGVPKVTPNDLRRTFASWLVQARESLFVVATLMGHSSTRMVEKIYGRLDAATLAGAIGKLPRGVPMNADQKHDPECNAGVTYGDQNGGKPGSSGTTTAQAAIVNSVEESVVSSSNVVPRDRIELSTP